jgi:uncharacterized RDD family membrane protein YckC
VSPVEPVALWRRSMAVVLDLLVVLSMMFALVVTRILWFVPNLIDRVQPEPWGRPFVLQCLFVVLSGALFITFVPWSLGQTPGRDKMNVRVVGLSGDDVGVGGAALRWAPIAVAAMMPGVWPGLLVLAACGLPAAFGSTRRSLFDRCASTRVVRFDRTAHEESLRGGDDDTDDDGDSTIGHRTRRRRPASGATLFGFRLR